MRLFLKHIFRTVRRAPWQPILILLTVVLSTAVSVTAFRCRDMIAEHAYETSHANAALGDVTVSLRGDSAVRMLFAEDAQAAVGASAEVLGEYALTAFTSLAGTTKLLSVAAVDLAAADEYFAFSYVEYGNFNTQDLEHSLILSEPAAKSLGLHVGDRLCLRVLDVEIDYTVQAIAREDGLLDERDVLIPISGVTRLLAARVPMIASLGDSFKPYNRLLVRASEGSDAEAVAVRLSETEAFDGARIERTVSDARMEYTVLVQTVSISLLALLIVVLSGMLIATSLSLLHAQRSMEYALFCSAGASRSSISLLCLTESWIYAVTGGVAGIVLAAPMLDFVGRLFDWQTQKVYVEIEGILFGLVLSVGLMTLCTALQLQKQRTVMLAVWLQEENNETALATKRGKPVALIPLLLTLLLICLILLVPVKYRYLPGVAAILTLVRYLYAVVSPLLRMLATALERLTERARHPRASLLLAFKNIRNHAAVQHTGKLLAVAFTLLLVVVLCTSVVDDQLGVSQGAISGDLLVVGLPTQEAQTLRNDSAVEGVASLDFVADAEIGAGYTAFAIIASGDVRACVNNALLPLSMPQGNEIALSLGIAELLGADVGDTVTLSLQGVPYTRTVSEIMRVSANIVVLDMATVGSSQAMTCVKLTDQAAASRVIADMEAAGAITVEKDGVMQSINENLGGFLRLLHWAIPAALVPVLIGGCNVLAAQYQARRREKRLLYACGMRVGSICLMRAVELLTVAVAAVLLAAAFGWVACMLINACVQSFGFLLF